MIRANERSVDRRAVLKAAGAAGLLLAGGAFAATASSRKRYAVVGVGSRARAHVHVGHYRQIQRS